MKKFVNVFSPQVGDIDHDDVWAGMELFDRAKPHLLASADWWPYFRRDMVNLGFPGEWLPENFQSPEELKQFVDEADRVNSRLRFQLAATPQKQKKPTRKKQPSRYDPVQEFYGLVQDAYKLGIAPPASPDPEELQRWKIENSQWAEQKKIQNYQSAPDVRRKSGPWGI